MKMKYLMFEGRKISLKQARDIREHYSKAFENKWYKKDTHPKQYKSYQDIEKLIIKHQ